MQISRGLRHEGPFALPPSDNALYGRKQFDMIIEDIVPDKVSIMEQHRSTTRALDILQMVASSLDGFTLTEMAEQLDAPRSSLFPIIHTLADRGFIMQDPKSMKYSIGIQAYAVGSAYLGTNDAYGMIYNEMERIADTCKETCQLGILDGDQVLYIGKVDSGEVIRLSSHVGKRLPVHCTALGKALASRMSYAELRALCKEPLVRRTEHTITDLSVLYEQLQQVQIDGLASDRQETQENVQCLAIPLFHHGKPAFAISVSVPLFRFTGEKEQLARSCLLDAKQRLEAALEQMQIALPY